MAPDQARADIRLVLSCIQPMVELRRQLVAEDSIKPGWGGKRHADLADIKNGDSAGK